MSEVVVLSLTKKQKQDLEPIFERLLTEVANGNRDGALFGIMFQPFIKGHMQAAYVPAPIAKSIQRILKRHGFIKDPKVQDEVSTVFVEVVDQQEQTVDQSKG